MSPVNHVIHNAEDNGRSNKEATPVHGLSRNSYRRGPKAKEECNCNVYQADSIRKWPQNWSHMPRTPVELVLDWIVSKSLVQDKGNRDAVGGHETCHNDTQDCVESGGTANIDESEKEGYGSRDQNRV
jgi:hypothetical protein